MIKQASEKLYAYRTSLPCRLSYESLWRYLSEQARDIAYAAPSAQLSQTGEWVISMRPLNRLGLYHNSFRPVIELSLQVNTLQIRCTLTKGIRWFICILSYFLLLLQVAFLFIAQQSWTWFLPLGMLFFLHLMSITGLGLTSDRLVKDLFKDAQTKQD